MCIRDRHLPSATRSISSFQKLPEASALHACGVQEYAAARIPLDTIWSDIDHMDGFRDFTLDKSKYAVPEMRALLRRLHAAGRHWVPIIDSGIKVDPGYPAYDAGLEADVFLKGVDGQPYVGQVRAAAP